MYSVTSWAVSMKKQVRTDSQHIRCSPYTATKSPAHIESWLSIGSDHGATSGKRSDRIWSSRRRTLHVCSTHGCTSVWWCDGGGGGDASAGPPPEAEVAFAAAADDDDDDDGGGGGCGGGGGGGGGGEAASAAAAASAA